MTKGKKTVSKTNDGTSESLQKVLRFGRGESGHAKDVDAINLDSLEAIPEEIVGKPNLPQAVQISTVRVFQSHLHQCYYFILFAVY